MTPLTFVRGCVVGLVRHRLLRRVRSKGSERGFWPKGRTAEEAYRHFDRVSSMRMHDLLWWRDASGSWRYLGSQR